MSATPTKTPNWAGLFGSEKFRRHALKQWVVWLLFIGVGDKSQQGRKELLASICLYEEGGRGEEEDDDTGHS